MILDKLIDGLQNEDDCLLLELAEALRPAVAVAEAVKTNTGIAIQNVQGSGFDCNVVITLQLTLDERNELLCFLAGS